MPKSDRQAAGERQANHWNPDLANRKNQAFVKDFAAAALIVSAVESVGGKVDGTMAPARAMRGKSLPSVRGEATISSRGERHMMPPWGLHGGKAGSRSITAIRRNDGRLEIKQGRIMLLLTADKRFVALTAGGGGNGNPLKRAPDAVLADVLDRKVSRVKAAEIYGVVITDGLALDPMATAQLRGTLAGAHKIELFDRGKEGLGLDLVAA